MARRCHSESLWWYSKGYGFEKYDKFWEKWQNRWLELAERFKPNNSTAQYDKGKKMTKFATKKPVTIECLKWTGVNFDEIKEFCGDAAETHYNVVRGCDELLIKTLEGIHHASEGDYIIKGVNGEFYPCKPDIFEKTYEFVDAPEAKPTDFVHSFSWALELLKKGKKVCRTGWNGKGMFLTLQKGSIVKGTMMRNEPAKEFYGDGDVKICPHIDMKAADGSYVVGWLASQTDMLADDWAITE